MCSTILRAGTAIDKPSTGQVGWASIVFGNAGENNRLTVGEIRPQETTKHVDGNGQAAFDYTAGYLQGSSQTKLLATIHRYITESISRNPNAPEFRQADTLGPDNWHWFRAKFLQRYRLFFRFSTKNRVIVYVWVNDEFTLRTSGSKTDAYAVFKSMLNAGNLPHTVEALLKHSKEMWKEIGLGPKSAMPALRGGLFLLARE
jgi:Toxin with endonuclease activity, of toxin-antitoxin system